MLEGYTKAHTIQSLWSDYGEIARYQSTALPRRSLVVKHINLQKVASHPRGWQSDFSHQRKLSSYLNELSFYQAYSADLPLGALVPKFVDSTTNEKQLILVMEDLDSAGYRGRCANANINVAKQGLSWLAHFHAHFMNVDTHKLWQQGTYWHLDTRPDELAAMPNCALKEAAKHIDQCLKNASFTSLLHGDAKLANFCFHTNGVDVAAVDFQYVGRGAPVKDVIYFIGSCFYGDALTSSAPLLFDYYLAQLDACLDSQYDKQAVRDECKRLYPFAWADFERFMLGWSPSHKKLSDYSATQTQLALAQL
jgi:hypothetical protein